MSNKFFVALSITSALWTTMNACIAMDPSDVLPDPGEVFLTTTHGNYVASPLERNKDDVQAFLSSQTFKHLVDRQEKSAGPKTKPSAKRNASLPLVESTDKNLNAIFRNPIGSSPELLAELNPEPAAKLNLYNSSYCKLLHKEDWEILNALSSTFRFLPNEKDVREIVEVLDATEQQPGLVQPKDIERFETLFLEALCQNRNMANLLDDRMLAAVSIRFWRLSQDSIRISQASAALGVTKTPEIKKAEYVSQAMGYAISSAKTGNPVGYLYLLEMINGNKTGKTAYKPYYTCLIPLLENDD